MLRCAAVEVMCSSLLSSKMHMPFAHLQEHLDVNSVVASQVGMGAAVHRAHSWMSTKYQINSSREFALFGLLAGATVLATVAG